MLFHIFYVSLERLIINNGQGPGGEELRRDFTYIDDIVAGVVGAVDAIPPSGKGSAHNKCVLC